jgi:hypothetical protein
LPFGEIRTIHQDLKYGNSHSQQLFVPFRTLFLGGSPDSPRSPCVEDAADILLRTDID